MTPRAGIDLADLGLLRRRKQVAKQRQVLLPQHEDVQPAEQGVELIGGEVAFLIEFGLEVPQAEVDALDPRA